MRGQKPECVFVQLYLLLTKKEESIYAINQNRLQVQENSCVENKGVKGKIFAYYFKNYSEIDLHTTHINICCILEIFA